MKKIHVWIEVPDDKYAAYRFEARRKGVSVERLLGRVLDVLLREEEQRVKDGTDHPIIIS